MQGTPKRTSIEKFYWYRVAANIAMLSITKKEGIVSNRYICICLERSFEDYETHN